MNAITYKNTKTTLPNWVPTIHEDEARGVAYQKDGFCIHIYGKSYGLWVQSVGLTATEQKQCDIEDWAVDTFGADEIETMTSRVGEAIDGVWRPGLYYQTEIYQAIGVTEYQQKSAEQALKILIEKLDDLFIYIEPSPEGLKAYSHKTRELLILACTEVENIWKQYMDIAGEQPSGANFNTNDYVKLLKPLSLSEFEVSLKPYNAVNPFEPFGCWDATRPTQSITWYDAYNKTKHDRNSHFKEATLEACIHSVCANIVLFCVRYGPYLLYQGQGTLSALFNQLFEISIIDPDPKTFYVPSLTLPANYRTDLVCGDTKKFIDPWKKTPLIL